jgi:hypothetical protein
MTADEILVDTAMRDYLSVRADMWEVRKQAATLNTATVGSFAVGFSALAALAPANIGSTTWALLLLAGAALLEFACMSLIGLDGSHKIAEDLNRRQADDIRSLLERVSGGSVPDTLLSFQAEVQRINNGAPSRVWLASYGAWSVAGFVMPFLAISCTLGGGYLLFSGKTSGDLQSLASLLLIIDVVGGAFIAELAVLRSQLHRDRDASA